MDKIVRKTLSEALAKLNDATFAFETVAHMRGMERELLPITDLLRIQQTLMRRILDPEQPQPVSDHLKDDPEAPISRKEFVEILVGDVGVFAGGIPPRNTLKSFETWFKQFEGDVFAPAGG